MDPWPPPPANPVSAPPPPYPYADPLTYALPPRRPRVWTVFLAFAGAMLGGLILPAFVMVPLALARFGPDAFEGGMTEEKLAAVLADPVVFLPTIASTQLVLIGVSLAGAMLSPVPWQKRLRLGRPRLPWHGWLVAVVGTMALGITLSVAIEMLGWGNKGTLKMFQDALSGLRGPALVAAALVVGLAPGLGEEMLFRGYVQTRLTRRWGMLASILITSALFAVIHWDWVQGGAVLFLGVFFGLMTERAGSIWPAVLCHAANNSIFTLLAPLESGGAPLVAPAVRPVVLAVSLVVVAACLAYLLLRPAVPVEEPVDDRLPPMMPPASPGEPMGYGPPPTGPVA